MISNHSTMKIYSVLFVAFVIGLSSCGSDDSSTNLSPDLVNNPATASTASATSNEEMAKMVFKNSELNFGTIVQGESIVKLYEFTNEGDVDLIISSANGSCGCTIPKWPKKPIKKGEKGVIEVVFNSQGKEGIMNKKVYITANTTPTNNVIALKGEVVAPK